MLQLFGHLEHVHFNVTWSACASKDASKQPKSTSNYLYYYSFFNYFNMMIFPTTEGYWVFIKIKVVYSQFCLELRKYKLNEKEHKANIRLDVVWFHEHVVKFLETRNNCKHIFLSCRNSSP